MNLDDFKKCPILGILRGISEKMVGPIVDLSLSAGLRAIEVTMNTPNAPSLIQKMVKAADGRLAVGAGTVLALKELQMALDAGATFIVSPILVAEIAVDCVKRRIPFFPGALTPQEIYSAWQAGATMVKVFPASQVGPSYFKDIKGPFDTIELLACGGVNASNIKDFFLNKASAVAFGNNIFKPDLLEKKDFSGIETGIRDLLAGIPWQTK
ncbi:MAG: bifunctional 4-hydroxy-2-oxoglutarate aldolase/2-dehydro-3-deoxy-phosphogluconate aldolase [Proteobacteria bacterium]|nr:bifunctional 4-hydroxy-2-oxoglutarate aldolase/2-dehydro-3-deoxy-phosphogluconate aldolase [Pseudomonadota bacterium]